MPEPLTLGRLGGSSPGSDAALHHVYAHDVWAGAWHSHLSADPKQPTDPWFQVLITVVHSFAPVPWQQALWRGKTGKSLLYHFYYIAIIFCFPLTVWIFNRFTYCYNYSDVFFHEKL